MLYWHGNLPVFHQFYTREQHEFLFASLEDVALQIGPTLQGKNLLLEEQILPLKSRPLLREDAKRGKIAELFHLKEYPFTLKSWIQFTTSIKALGSAWNSIFSPLKVSGYTSKGIFYLSSHKDLLLTEIICVVREQILSAVSSLFGEGNNPSTGKPILFHSSCVPCKWWPFEWNSWYHINLIERPRGIASYVRGSGALFRA